MQSLMQILSGLARTRHCVSRSFCIKLIYCSFAVIALCWRANDRGRCSEMNAE